MKSKILIVFLIIISLFVISGCSKEEIKDYIDHIKNPPAVFENKISFSQEEYFVTKQHINNGLKTILKVEIEELEYLDKIEFTLDDISCGTVDENGVITPYVSFDFGTTTLRARISELNLEAFVKITFLPINTNITGVSMSGKKSSLLILEEETTINILCGGEINNNDFEIEFLNPNIEVIETGDNGTKVKSHILGPIDYLIKVKGYDYVLYRNTIKSSLQHAAIETRVRTLLNKAESDCITVEELSSISNLDDGTCFMNTGITNLDDFKYFPLVTSLNLAYNPIEIVDFNLPQITSLNLSYSNVKQFNTTSNDYSLEELNLNGCNLTAFDDSKLNKLRILYLNGNQNIVKNLNLTGNDNLVYLNVADCKLDSINVNNCTNLKYLLAPGNNITDLSNFANISLKVLDIANCKVSSLEFLQNHSELIELYIGGNPMSTTEFSYISKDVRLNFVRTNLSITGHVDVNVLKDFILDCQSLWWLQIYGMGLTDVSYITITSMPNLKYIKVSHNNILDISTLSYIQTVVSQYDDYRQDVE